MCTNTTHNTNKPAHRTSTVRIIEKRESDGDRQVLIAMIRPRGSYRCASHANEGASDEIGSTHSCTSSVRKVSSHFEYLLWPWCNLAASQRRPYCASVNSHSPVGLISRQWDAVDWVCVLCDRRIHNDSASRSASSRQCACPFYSSRAGFFGKASHHPGLSAPPTVQIWLPATSYFPKAKIAVEREEICEFDGHTVHKLIQRRLTADWLAPRESVHGCTVMFRLTGCRVTSRPRDLFSRYSEWLDTFRTALVLGTDWKPVLDLGAGPWVKTSNT